MLTHHISSIYKWFRRLLDSVETLENIYYDENGCYHFIYPEIARHTEDEEGVNQLDIEE